MGAGRQAVIDVIGCSGCCGRFDAGSGQLAYDTQQCVRTNALGLAPSVWRRWAAAFEPPGLSMLSHHVPCDVVLCLTEVYNHGEARASFL